MPAIEQNIIDIISGKTGIERSEISPDSHFQDDLNLSETETLELITRVEEHFSLEIPPEEIEDIETVQDLINSIKDYLNDVS